MKFNTIGEFKTEIARVEAAMKKTESVFVQRDYGKYKKKLEKEMRRLAHEVRQQEVRQQEVRQQEDCH